MASKPSRDCTAPVKAPFTYPNSSLSIRVGTSEPQSTGMNGLSRKGPEKWMEAGNHFLPCPAFAQDQHWMSAVCRFADNAIQLFHLGTSPYDDAETKFGLY